MDEARRQRLSERAHAVWEREGRPEGQAERHWATAEEELRAEEQEQGQAGAADAEGTAAASTAATETWTGPDGSVGGEPRAEDQGQARTPAAEGAEAPLPGGGEGSRS